MKPQQKPYTTHYLGITSSVASRRFAPRRAACLSLCAAEDLASLGPRRRTALPEVAGSVTVRDLVTRPRIRRPKCPRRCTPRLLLFLPPFLRLTPATYCLADRPIGEVCNGWFRDYSSEYLDTDGSNDDLEHMRHRKAVYDCAREQLWGASTSSTYDYGGKCFRKPMSVVQHLLADMVSTADTFIAKPSIEGARRWDHIAIGRSFESLSLTERQRFDELMKIHASVSQELDLVCHYLQ